MADTDTTTDQAAQLAKLIEESGLTPREFVQMIDAKAKAKRDRSRESADRRREQGHKPAGSSEGGQFTAGGGAPRITAGGKSTKGQDVATKATFSGNVITELELTQPGTDPKQAAGALEKAGQLFELWKKTQLTAQAAKKVAAKAGAGPKLAEAAFWLAAIGDNVPIPPIPGKGAAVVVAVASLFKPSAGVEAVADTFKAAKRLIGKAAVKLGIKSKPAEKSADEQINAFAAAVEAGRAAPRDFDVPDSTVERAVEIAKKFAGQDEDQVLALMLAASQVTDDIDEIVRLVEAAIGLQDNET